MSGKSSAILAFVCLGLMGCAAPSAYERYKAGEVVRNYPYKAGATLALQQREITDCQVEAAQRVPVNNVTTTTPVISSPSQTYCNQIGTQTMCNTYGGQTYGGTSTTKDTNTALRARVIGQCMAARGYRYVDIPACPQGVQVMTSNVLPALSQRTCYLVVPDGRSAIGTY